LCHLTIRQEKEACQRLITIPGVGRVTATALIAAIGNRVAFRKGREFAAWIGVVPREYSTGGKQKLLGISKRGNPYLRRLFVQGARSVMMHRTKQSSGLSQWLEKLSVHKHHNIALVALAHMAWAVLATG
jgi:transposase